jgi:hypothetical protein
VRLTRDTLVVDVARRGARGTPVPSDSGFLRLPVLSVHGLELSDGRHGHFELGLALGALGGAAVGAVSGYAQGDDPDYDRSLCLTIFFPFPCLPPATAEMKAVTGGLRGLAVGALVGGIAGVLFRTERWLPVPLDEVSVGLRLLPYGRTAVMLSLTP